MRRCWDDHTTFNPRFELHNDDVYCVDIVLMMQKWMCVHMGTQKYSNKSCIMICRCQNASKDYKKSFMDFMQTRIMKIKNRSSFAKRFIRRSSEHVSMHVLLWLIFSLILCVRISFKQCKRLRQKKEVIAGRKVSWAFQTTPVLWFPKKFQLWRAQSL